ncbi:retrovirus-related pol polyprotein from transposon TNT 1-94 [Tanacetum coccineum]
MSSPNLSLNQSTTSQDIHNHKIYTIGFTHNPNHTTTQDNYNRDLILRRREERSLNNNSFLGEYECSSLAIDRRMRGEERLDHLKQDQTINSAVFIANESQRSSAGGSGENGELESYLEALSSNESIQWKKASNEEINSLEKNQMLSLVRLLAVKGFQQKQRADYNEIFSPVMKMTKIMLVLSIVASEDLYLEKLDVKITFLHGNLDEDIYMAQPEDFQSAGKEENLMCMLKKSLYGLKQAPRQWYLKFDSFMQRAGYKRCVMDHCCYLKMVGSSSIILLLYVDDMLVAGSDMAEIKKLKRQLSQEFKMKDLGSTKQILGMSIIRDITKGTLRLSLEKYIGKVLEKFNMKDAEARCQPLGDQFKLKGFSDLDYGGCLDSGKSTMGYVFTVGGIAVSWMSKIRKCVAMSTTEGEYMDIAEASKELVWLKNFLEELDRAQTECVLYCDNQSAIRLAKNLVFHGRTKHIKIRYHYIRELVSEGTLSLKKILGAKNLVDMLIMVVTTEKLKLCATLTGLRDN